MNLFIFTHALSKTPLQVFIITIPGRRNLPIFHKERFLKIYFLQQKEGALWSWKDDQN